MHIVRHHAFYPKDLTSLSGLSSFAIASPVPMFQGGRPPFQLRGEEDPNRGVYTLVSRLNPVY